nr:MAG TPA: SCIMP protein [Ackermannviridae sp.]
MKKLFQNVCSYFKRVSKSYYFWFILFIAVSLIGNIIYCLLTE